MLNLSLINFKDFFMKKLIILVIVFLIFTFGVIMGKSWAQNSWITSAVNKALEASGQTQNAATAAKLNGLKNCQIEGGLTSTQTGKEANLKCLNAQDETVKLKASAIKDGKILFFNKYKFEGIEVL
jgi:hypothetical protein